MTSSVNLRHKVDLLVPESKQNELGEPGENWVVYAANIWAEVTPLSGTALQAAQSVHTDISVRVTLRYAERFSDPELMATMRVRYRKQLFSVLASIDQRGLRRFIDLQCKQGVRK